MTQGVIFFSSSLSISCICVNVSPLAKIAFKMSDLFSSFLLASLNVVLHSLVFPFGSVSNVYIFFTHFHTCKVDFSFPSFWILFSFLCVYLFFSSVDFCLFYLYFAYFTGVDAFACLSFVLCSIPKSFVWSVIVTRDPSFCHWFSSSVVLCRCSVTGFWLSTFNTIQLSMHSNSPNIVSFFSQCFSSINSIPIDICTFWRAELKDRHARLLLHPICVFFASMLHPFSMPLHVK